MLAYKLTGFNNTFKLMGRFDDFRKDFKDSRYDGGHLPPSGVMKLSSITRANPFIDQLSFCNLMN
jgi:hypothetical protein